MDNLEAMLREALKNKSKEEVAKEFTETLNKMEDGNDKRNKRVTLARTTIRDAVRNDTWPAEMVGEIAILAFEKSHPEWDANTLSEFAKSIVDGTKTSTKLIGAEPDKAARIMLDELNVDDIIHDFVKFW